METHDALADADLELLGLADVLELADELGADGLADVLELADELGADGDADVLALRLTDADALSEAPESMVLFVTHAPPSRLCISRSYPELSRVIRQLPSTSPLPKYMIAFAGS